MFNWQRQQHIDAYEAEGDGFMASVHQLAHGWQWYLKYRKADGTYGEERSDLYSLFPSSKEAQQDVQQVYRNILHEERQKSSG
ncbi:MAG: hypothetical protein IT324_05195 [Anaerolineae bacterium]|nr:hypothetical protein [Anaerolineae bacterium]